MHNNYVKTLLRCSVNKAVVIVVSFFFWVLLCGCSEKVIVWEKHTNDISCFVVSRSIGHDRWETRVIAKESKKNEILNILISSETEQIIPDYFVGIVLSPDGKCLELIINNNDEYLISSFNIISRYSNLRDYAIANKNLAVSAEELKDSRRSAFIEYQARLENSRKTIMGEK